MARGANGSSVSKRPRNHETENGVDRLSALPDSILHHILSFLPTLLVVRTCILSKRWKEVWEDWNGVPSLAFDSYDFISCSNFATFVIEFFLRYKATAIQRFKFATNSGFTEMMISLAATLKVQELDLSFYSDYFLSPLPRAIFGCTTLVALSLRYDIHRFHMEFPSSACIPCLKTLVIDSLISPDGEFENRLIACCVVLENLSIRFRFRVGIKRLLVNAPMLKWLKLDFYNGPEPHPHGFHVIDINAPSLEEMEVNDNGPCSLLLASEGSAMRKAKINLDDPKAFESFLKCFSGLKNVKSLHLSSGRNSNLACRLDPGRIDHFVNLIHLTLGVRSVWVSLLHKFFQSFPNLEVLQLKKESDLIPYAGLKLRLDSVTLPPRLRVFVVEEFRGTGHELGKLEYILKNGESLEMVKVHYLPLKFVKGEEERRELERKDDVAQTIASFPKASEKCKIIFTE